MGMSEQILTVLRAKRSEISSQVTEIEKKLARLRAALANLDAAMNILTPDHPDHIPDKRRLRTNYFALGELSRLIRETLRDASKPLSAGEIAASVIGAKGFPLSSHLTVTKMVIGRLGALTKRGELTKTGRTRDARWAVANFDQPPNCK